MSERFDGWLEVDGATGTVAFYTNAKAEALVSVTGIPTPLPLLIGTDSMLVEITHARCNFDTNTGSGRVWGTKPIS